MEKNYSLSETERLILLNQYMIMSKLADFEADDASEYYFDSDSCDEAIEILTSGYEHEYDSLFSNIRKPMSLADSKFVWDVLELYSKIYFSTKGSEYEAKAKFPGFDGNNEAGFLGYCKFVFTTLDRYHELQNEKQEYNSHFPAVGKYKNMLEQWNAMGKNHMSCEDAVSLLNVH